MACLRELATQNNLSFSFQLVLTATKANSTAFAPGVTTKSALARLHTLSHAPVSIQCLTAADLVCRQFTVATHSRSFTDRVRTSQMQSPVRGDYSRPVQLSTIGALEPASILVATLLEGTTQMTRALSRGGTAHWIVRALHSRTHLLCSSSARAGHSFVARV